MAGGATAYHQKKSETFHLLCVDNDTASEIPLATEREGCGSESAAKIQDLATNGGIEIHMRRMLVDGSSAVKIVMGVEAGVGALLDSLEAIRNSELEYSVLLPRVSWRHDDSDSLLKHRLVGAMRVQVDGTEEACLPGMRVDPPEREELPTVLLGKDLLLVHSRDGIGCGGLLRHDQGRHKEYPMAHLPRQDGARLQIALGVQLGKPHEGVHQVRRHVQRLGLRIAARQPLRIRPHSRMNN